MKSPSPICSARWARTLLLTRSDFFLVSSPSRSIGKVAVEVFDDDQLENGVAQELEALVRATGISAIATEERTVGQCLLEDAAIPEADASLAFEGRDHVLDALRPVARWPGPSQEPKESHCASPPTRGCLARPECFLRLRVLELPDHEAHVVPTEPQGVRHRIADRAASCLVGNIVEVTLRIGVLVVDRRGDQTFSRWRGHRRSTRPLPPLPVGAPSSTWSS